MLMPHAIWLAHEPTELPPESAVVFCNKARSRCSGTSTASGWSWTAMLVIGRCSTMVGYRDRQQPDR